MLLLGVKPSTVLVLFLSLLPSLIGYSQSVHKDKTLL